MTTYQKFTLIITTVCGILALYGLMLIIATLLKKWL